MTTTTADLKQFRQQLARKTFDQASRREVASGDRRRGAGRARCKTARDGKNKQILRQTRRQINQYVRLCVERCPLTARQTTKPSGNNCGSESARTRLVGDNGAGNQHRTTPSLDWMATWKPRDNVSRSQLHSNHRKERTMSGIATESQSDHHSSGTSDFHAQ